MWLTMEASEAKLRSELSVKHPTRIRYAVRTHTPRLARRLRETRRHSAPITSHTNENKARNQWRLGICQKEARMTAANFINVE